MSELTGKRLALMGTENGTDDVLRFARENGITLVSFGNKPEARIHQISDEQCYVNCTDADVMIPLLKEKKIDGIFLCTAEKVIRLCLTYLEKAGYRHYATLEQWDTLMNKALFKQCAKKYGVSVLPEFELDEDGHVVGEISFPAIVKPADACGSVGACVCSSKEEVQAAAAQAKKASVSGRLICERFLHGDFFQFEVWMQNGKAWFPFVKERIVYPGIGSRPVQPFLDIAPASFADTIEKFYYEKVEKMLHELGIRNGGCWFEGIMENGVPYITDVGFRLSGGQDWKAVREDKGVDLIESHIRYALTGAFGRDFSALAEPMEHAYTFICPGLKNGTIRKIEGMDAIRALPQVVSVYQYMDEGRTVKTSGLYSQSLCRILVKADDWKQLKKNVAEVLGLLKVTDENGEPMLRELPAEYDRWIMEE